MTAALRRHRLRMARWIAGDAWPREPAPPEPTPADCWRTFVASHPPASLAERQFDEFADRTLAAASQGGDS